jgi:four helix bundle protein
MHSPLQIQLLNEITAIISGARPFVAAIERRDRDLGNQMRRALNSVALNVAEGFGCRAGNARNRFESAHGSLFEVRAAFDAAAAWQYVDTNDVDELRRRMHSLGGRLYGLMRR